MVSKKIIDSFLKSGKRLNLLHKKQKTPIYKNWNTRTSEKEELYNHDGNIGWVIGSENLVIDVDIKNGGIDSYEKLLKTIAKKDSLFNGSASVITGSGGIHVYLVIPEIYRNKRFKKRLKEFPGIDFLTFGSYCLIPGCETEKGLYSIADDITGDLEERSAPRVLVDMILKGDRNNEIETIGVSQDLSKLAISSANIDPNQIVNWLTTLDPGMNYDEWLKVGMALHNWDSIEGLELWENWSIGGENYKAGETKKKWSSFDNKGGISVFTLRHMVKDLEYDERVRKLNKYLEEIDFKNEKDIEFDIIPKIKRENFNDMESEKICVALQRRYKDLTGIKVSINQIRSQISSKLKNEYELDIYNPEVEWCLNWYYINGQKSFIDIETLNLYKTEGFNLLNGKHVPMNKNGYKQSAVKFCQDNSLIRFVDSMAYLPNYDGKICYIGGVSYVNIFKKDSIPPTAEEYTKEGKEAINAVLDHISLLFDGVERDCKILLQWLAFQVKFPGKKILWAPMIQSIEGLGKSFFGELLRVCLGTKNVGVVSPTQVCSQFNKWASNVCVNILEELRLQGHNRYDVVNALKPLITDRIVQINDKGITQYDSFNVTNYICFTNFKDAIPIDKNDRRWWVTFVKLNELSEVETKTGIPVGKYFPRLFSLTANNAPEIRKWLLEYEITEEFMNMKQAPMSDSKYVMINNELSANIDGFIEIEELLKRGSRYYNKDVIFVVELFKDLEQEYPEVLYNGRQKNYVLKKMGYIQFPLRFKVGDTRSRVWTRNVTSEMELKAKFAEMSSFGSEDDDSFLN